MVTSARAGLAARKAIEARANRFMGVAFGYGRVDSLPPGIEAKFVPDH